MNLLSWPVVLGTLLLASPAIYAGFDGTLSTDAALERVAVCAVVAWAACSVLVSLSTRAVRTNQVATAERTTADEPATETTG